MSLKTSYSDDNFVLDEGLVVTNSQTIIQGNWSWESISASGSFTRMREVHRYARKSFRYVGMTYAAAKSCKTDMVSAFTRTFKTSFWDGSVNQGQWNTQNGGTMVMADVAIVPAGGDAYDVVVRVNEDDVRTMKVETTYSYDTVFATEKNRTYGSDGHGSDAETE